MSMLLNRLQSLGFTGILTGLILGIMLIFPLQAYSARETNSDQPVIVVLSASWCGTCREIIPVIDKIVGMLPEKRLKVITLDVDDNNAPVIAKPYGITITGSDVPQIYLFNQGKTTLLFSGKNYKFGQSKQAEQQILDRLKNNLP